MKKHVLVVSLTIVLLLPLVLAVRSSSGLQTVTAEDFSQKEVNSFSDVSYWDTRQLTANGYSDTDPQIDNGMVTWYGYDGNDYEIFLWNGTVYQLTDNDYHDRYPQIDNGMVTWYGYDGNDNEIFLWNGTVYQLTDNGYSDHYPQIDNGIITWIGMDRDGNDNEVYLWNGTVYQLTDNDYPDYNPQIDNGMVTWYGEDGSDFEIFFWNGTVHQLTDNGYDDTDPQIDNGMVTWYGYDGNDNEIFLWNGTTHQLTDNDHYEFSPQIDNGMVTWCGEDGGDYEIFFWNGTVYQLTYNINNDQYPQIDNGLVTWQHGDGIADEIFLWNGIVHQLTDNGYNDEYPQIDNGYVTWYGNDGNDYEIFLYCPDELPPRIDHPDDLAYEESTTGHLLTWTPIETNPYWYNITRDGTIIEDGPWEGDSISTSVDGLSPGNHEYSCVVYDALGLWSNDVVIVQVIPLSPSWVFAPTDQVIPYDNPFDYQLAVVDPSGILSWWINDTDLFELTATYYHEGSTARLTNKVVLPLGEYGISVVVTDFDGFTLTGDFNVIVTDITSPEWIEIYPAQHVEYGDNADFDVSATDSSGISQYWVDDARFSVDETGRVRSIQFLPIGELGLGVFVNDSYGNINATYITIIVADTTAPSWVSQPENQVLEFGTALSYQLEATDLSGIASWTVNNTASFAIVGGLLTNTEALIPGIYGLEISVTDLHGNSLNSSINIRVNEDTTTTTTTTSTTTTITTTTTTSTTTSTSTTTTDTTPLDAMPLFVLSIGGIGVAVIIIVIMMKRRQ